MKTRIDAIVQRDQAKYLDDLLPKSSRLLSEMEKYALRRRIPIADREVALFLEITVNAINAARVLEIGAAIGYSMIHMARAMPEGGIVISIEPNEEMIRLAKRYIQHAGLSDRTRIVKGKALDILPQLNETFDLIFFDAIKEEYRDYLRLAVPMLRRGGVIVADNLLWGGQVAGQKRQVDLQALELRKFNRDFMKHKQLKSVILPVGDGLGYSVKR